MAQGSIHISLRSVFQEHLKINITVIQNELETYKGQIDWNYYCEYQWILIFLQFFFIDVCIT